ncbi:uncharacterized protein TNCV_3597781 [Trichonephila clavipes]|nr:uncharacterized protein TNCV_3597781 [Trichonephila clavipes]
MTLELASPLQTTTPHQREEVYALDRFSVHRCPTRRVFSGTGLELMTRQVMIRYLYHSTIAAINCEGLLMSYDKTTRGPFATGIVNLNHVQVTRTTPELAPPLRTSTTRHWKDFEQVSEFDGGRTVAFRESGLLFRDISRRFDQDLTTTLRIWNQWVLQGHTERRAGSSLPPMTYCEGGSSNHTNLSRTISQETGMFTAPSVSACTTQRR